jgi:vacuolar-type H+-ATPase subunit H
MKEKLREQKIKLVCMGKDPVGKVNSQMALVKSDLSLEKILHKDRGKENKCLRKGRTDLEQKHKKVIDNERKYSTDLQTKLHTTHEKQIKDVQKLRQDICNTYMVRRLMQNMGLVQRALVKDKNLCICTI